jgi:hypothetical protein
VSAIAAAETDAPPAACSPLSEIKEDTASFPWFPTTAVFCGYFRVGGPREPWYRERSLDDVQPPPPPPPPPDDPDVPDDPAFEAQFVQSKNTADAQMARFLRTIAGKRHSMLAMANDLQRVNTGLKSVVRWGR